MADPPVGVVDVDLIALGVDLLVEPRVHEGDVVALEVVVGVRLPVARQVVHSRERGCERLDGEVGARVGERPERVEQRRRVEIDVHEHEPSPLVDADRFERDRVAVDAVAEVARGAQLPIEVVGPAVIAAHEARDVPGPGRHERPRTMPAHVVVADEIAVVVHHHDDVPPRDVGGKEVTRCRQRSSESEEQPRVSEDVAPFDVVPCRVGVPGGGNCRGAFERR